MQFMSEILKDRPVENFSHSPLLTNPQQVNEILASATPERLLAGTPALPAVVTQKPSGATAVPHSVSTPPPRKEGDASRPLSPPAVPNKSSAPPVAEEVPPAPNQPTSEARR
jgi:hypothetical protein